MLRFSRQFYKKPPIYFGPEGPAPPSLKSITTVKNDDNNCHQSNEQLIKKMASENWKDKKVMEKVVKSLNNYMIPFHKKIWSSNKNDMIILDKMFRLVRGLAPGKKDFEVDVVHTEYTDQRWIENNNDDNDENENEYHFSTPIYTFLPEKINNKHHLDNLKIIIHIHGGGYSIGDVATYSPCCRAVANSLDAKVHAIDYRSCSVNEILHQIEVDKVERKVDRANSSFYQLKNDGDELTEEHHLVEKLHHKKEQLKDIFFEKHKIFSDKKFKHISKNIPKSTAKKSSKSTITQPDSINEAIAATKYILNCYPNKSVTLFGDSAGAHACINAVVESCQSNQNIPKNVVLLYPWTNLSKYSDSHLKDYHDQLGLTRFVDSFILNQISSHGIDEDDHFVNYNQETLNLLQSILRNDLHLDGGDPKILTSQKISKFLANPKFSPSLIPENELITCLRKGVNFYINIAELDVIADDGYDFYNKLLKLRYKIKNCQDFGQKMNDENNSSGTGEIRNWVSEGTTHGWWQLFCKQTRNFPFAETPEHDAEFDDMMLDIKKFIEK